MKQLSVVSGPRNQLYRTPIFGIQNRPSRGVFFVAGASRDSDQARDLAGQFQHEQLLSVEWMRQAKYASISAMKQEELDL